MLFIRYDGIAIVGIRFIIKSHTLSRVIGSGFRQVAQVCYYRLLFQTSNAPKQDRSCSDKIYLNLSGNLYSQCYSTQSEYDTI